ncbi:MAG: acetyl-CoA carboxylase, biotin carboxyl carrier protein [Candidatus Riflebacteria bacterium]|nr:acetyl-CoA carboxylase, biotin carboxyl carrier protein [Candidatus Riflebacteria bacterium]
MAKKKQLDTNKQQALTARLEELINFAGENNLAELSLKTKEFSFKVKKPKQKVISDIKLAPITLSELAPITLSEPAPIATPKKKAAVSEDNYDNHKTIVTPVSGTFYEAALPGGKPFVKCGDTIYAGQTVCIVEAMKMMNEIKADKDGKILKILPKNGMPVGKGDVILILEG